MPNARHLAAAVALLAAAALLVCLPGGASAKAAPVPPTKVQLVRQISKLDGQFHALRNRVKKCATAQTDLRVAQKQRNSAVAGASVKRTKASLKARRAKMAAAVVRLARAAKTCATSVTATSASVAAQPGPAPGTALVLLPDLLGGVQVNVSGLTDGLPLGTVLQLVDIDELTGPLCTAQGVSCIGIDTTALTQAVTRLLGANLVASLLNLDIADTLATLRALLGVGDLTSVVQVQRVSDTVFRLVPVGPLAGLAGLPAIPALPVGLVDLTG